MEESNMNKRVRGVLSLGLAVAMTLTLFAGCSQSSASSGNSASGSADAQKHFKFLSIWPETSDGGQLINDLSKQYAEKHKNFTFEFEMVASNNLRQKVKTLMAADELPDAFAYESGKPLEELINAGKVVNIEDSFKSAGIYDKMETSAVSLLKKLVGNKGLYDIPLGMNFEGFWYNKKMFADNGVKVPTTWDELETACQTFKSKNITAIAVGGKDKWPATRLVNAYVMRSLGSNAMQDGVAGKAKFTDASYVKAADVIQKMAKAGYFGNGVNTVDINTSVSMVLNNQAAMLYDGSWITMDLTDKTKNKLGDDGVGFFNVPTVAGGKGSMSDYSVNCGNIVCLSKKNYDKVTEDWMKYVFSNIADYAMTKQGRYLGFKVANVPSNVSPYTKLVGDELGKVKGTALWFEASFNDKATSAAHDNIQLLLTGSMTPADYFSNIQKSLSDE